MLRVTCRTAAAATLAVCVAAATALAATPASAGANTTTATSAATTAGTTTAGTTTAGTTTVPGTSPVRSRTAADVTADALPTTQIDGVVWSQAVVGDTVYAGGSFAAARPAGAAPGTDETPRGNLLAYSISTGNLVESFAPNLDAQVKAVAASPDGKRIYVGGTFLTADGQPRAHIAAYDTATGKLISTFDPDVNASVYAIVATNTTVYVGGVFGYADGVLRSRLAAFTASDGSLTGWAPSADYNVNALAISHDGTKIYAGGGFHYVNGTAVNGVTALSATSGAVLPFAVNKVIRAYGTGAAVLSLATDATGVYGTAYNYQGGGNFEGTFAAEQSTGAVRWIEDCHGDTYDVAPLNGIVYTVSHAHYCQTMNGWGDADPQLIRHSVAFTAAATGKLGHNTNAKYTDFYGQPSPSIIYWFPDLANGTATTAGQAAWSVTGNSQYVVEGGEFPTVNGVAQQGLVRFAVPSIAPDKQGPRVSGAAFAPTFRTLSNSAVQVSWTADWDRDDQWLTYQVFRDGGTTPIYTSKRQAQWWNEPQISFTDSGLAPGSTHTYQVSVTDGDGNQAVGDPAPVTLPAASTYATDSFDRAAASGSWGYADVGGPWTLTGSGFGLSGSAGTDVLTSTNRSTGAALAGVSATDSDTSIDVSAADVTSIGTGLYTTLVARRTASGEYRLKERLMAGGVVHLLLSRVVNGAETTLAEVPLSGVTYQAGDIYRLRFAVRGTQLSGWLWKSGTTQPATPQITAKDVTPALQKPGSTAVLFFLSAAATRPATISVDNLSSVAAG